MLYVGVLWICDCNEFIWKWERTLKTQVGFTIPCIREWGLQTDSKQGWKAEITIHIGPLSNTGSPGLPAKLYYIARCFLGSVTGSLHFVISKWTSVPLSHYGLCNASMIVPERVGIPNTLLKFSPTFEKMKEIRTLALITLGCLYIIRIWIIHNGIW